jgi:hypothetical protein
MTRVTSTNRTAPCRGVACVAALTRKRRLARRMVDAQVHGFVHRVHQRAALVGAARRRGRSHVALLHRAGRYCGLHATHCGRCRRRYSPRSGGAGGGGTTRWSASPSRSSTRGPPTRSARTRGAAAATACGLRTSTLIKYCTGKNKLCLLRAHN